ncbi:GMC family oxidoreductase [Candidatus Venteria ishoeyi]|uniref:GMC family oxidoreductase n=1 Tax=Candidatus Venteria ishoeyi TaxID=1899563 RepID=UPI0025A67CA9|nr:GMC family oxidoreductase [Candidatus Venteria ishoeyi]MDM8547032.1 GMC family oxidoreductase [Candidatus Venteria ishoeyi]
MNTDFDVCVIGSGAGGGPVALTLAQAGYSVLVLEKGPWFNEQDFYKDELACCLRETYTASLKDEPHVIEKEDDDGNWYSHSTYRSSDSFWNGNCVGGSSNFMSGFFHRLKPLDFQLKSRFGPIKGANVADWPISYEDLEPYYTKVEHEVGVSGRVVKHPHSEPRSTKDYPYPPTAEHPFATYIDEACTELGYHSLPMARAILSKPAMGRESCSYNGFCGAYGCATGAKGSARAALLNRAVATGRCEVRPHANVTRLRSDAKGRITHVEYLDAQEQTQHVNAKIYVLACQAIESARLLLLSTGEKYPQGLANSNGLVGKNLLFAGGGAGSGRFNYARFDAQKATALKQYPGAFINRALQDWYVIDDPDFGPAQKGGTIDFVHLHPNPVARATRQLRNRQGLIWGKPLQQQLKSYFSEGRSIKVEAFCDWLPIDDCFVSLDKTLKDKWQRPVAKVRTGFHVRNLQVGWYLANKSAEVLKKMGAEDVLAFASGSPPTNLIAGGCRFGDDPKTSVLNADCRAHEVDNLYVSDGSFMPTGGSVPYTWTIYANAFRVADKIVAQLGGWKKYA